MTESIGYPVERTSEYKGFMYWNAAGVTSSHCIVESASLISLSKQSSVSLIYLEKLLRICEFSGNFYIVERN